MACGKHPALERSPPYTKQEGSRGVAGLKPGPGRERSEVLQELMRAGT